MRETHDKKCPECGRVCDSLGFASHRAMHRRKREALKSAGICLSNESQTPSAKPTTVEVE